MVYLIIGGRGKAGQSAIAAIREQQREAGGNAAIYATTSQDAKVPGADHTISHININNPEATDILAEKARAALSASAVKALFYTPAFGPIGMPVSAVSCQEADEAIGISADPIRRLTQLLSPQVTVGYSAFYWLPHTIGTYGAMAYAKIALERLALQEPQQFKALRAGTFPSNASRGAALLIQRSLRKSDHRELQELKESAAASGKRFYDHFFDNAFDAERSYFQDRFPQPYRPTQPKDLTAATLRLLKGEEAPIVNVIGEWIWSEAAPPSLPAEFRLASQDRYGFRA